MHGSADTAGMPDVRSRAFFRFEIMCQEELLEIKLESAPHFSYPEMRAARRPFFGTRFGRIVSLAFLGSSSVAAFRGPNSDRRNEVYFAASQQAHKIIAPEALHSHAHAGLDVRADVSWVSIHMSWLKPQPTKIFEFSLRLQSPCSCGS
jgi:hypothetical protein